LVVFALMVRSSSAASPAARHPNDRLLLGMKGTISEMELATFRQRSQEALKLMSP